MSNPDNIEGLDVLNLEFLLSHHVAKQEHRQRQVDALNLQPGDVVLDLGCGPGLWSSMMAEKVKPNGRVIGVDFDAGYIEYANQQLKQKPLADLIEYRLGDFSQMSFGGDLFDVVFVSGCSAYFPDVYSFMNQQKAVTKPGGRIADRSWDDGLIIAHPISPVLTAKVMGAIAQAYEARSDEGYLDSYFGRKSHGVFCKSGLQNITTLPYVVQFLPPLSPEVKAYIAGNVTWQMKVGKPYLSAQDQQEWRGYFDSTSDPYIMDRDDFYYGMMEVLTIGTLK